MDFNYATDQDNAELEALNTEVVQAVPPPGHNHQYDQR